MRENLICLLENGLPVVPGHRRIRGDGSSKLVNAILPAPHFILWDCAVRQERILRQSSRWRLYEEIPILAGSEVNADPSADLRSKARGIAEGRESTPVAWLPREVRFVEKLRRPTSRSPTSSEDVDPIQGGARRAYVVGRADHALWAAGARHIGIFGDHELPDLAGQDSSGSQTIRQEGDVPRSKASSAPEVDVALVFRANHEGLHGERQDHHAPKRTASLGRSRPTIRHGGARVRRLRSRKRGPKATAGIARIPHTGLQARR